MSTDAPLLPDPASLPDDPALLKVLVVQLLEELQKIHAKLQRQEHHMHLLLKKIYGHTSEKSDPRRRSVRRSSLGRHSSSEFICPHSSKLTRPLPPDKRTTISTTAAARR